MRPNSIVTFERVFLIMIVLGLIGAVLRWDAVVAELRATGLAEGVGIAIYAFALAVSLLLLWLIARRGSSVARWIYVVLCVAGFALAIPAFGATLRLPLPELLMQIAQWLLAILSVWLLFRPDARAWFARSGDAAGA
jgi:hypothetical protein